MDDAWFQQQVKPYADEEEEEREPGGEGNPIPRLLYRAGPENASAGVLPPLVDGVDRVPWWETDWRRTWVSVYDVRCKVWFDNQSSPSGVRRGWANCPTCSAGCIRPVSHNRDWFATALALWVRRGTDQPHDRREHLSWWPPLDSDVGQALAHASFENF